MHLFVQEADFMAPSRLIANLACWLSGLCLLVCGCGVAEYEKKMDAAQKRLQRFEEESRLLDDPVTAPTFTDKSGKEVPGPSLFFRPPKGIGGQPAKELRVRLFHTYQPRSSGPVAGGFAYVELAFGDGRPEFYDEVLRSYTAAGERTTRTRVKGFQTTEFSDGQYFYSVNRWQGSDKPVVITYWIVPNSRTSTTDRTIDLSLESFAINGDVSRQRSAYERMRSTPLKPPESPR
jgi:hypothetical protein